MHINKENDNFRNIFYVNSEFFLSGHLDVKSSIKYDLKHIFVYKL